MSRQAKKADIAPVETQEQYRQRIMGIVCACLIEGKALDEICGSDIEGVPKRACTIRVWCAEDEELKALYMRARGLQADALLETLPNKHSEIIKRYLAEGWEPKDAINAARGEIDAEKWRMQRMFPKQCGDKVTLAGDPENPLAGMTDEQLLAKLEQLRKNDPR